MSDAPSGVEKLDGRILTNAADKGSLAKLMLVIGFGYNGWILIEGIELKATLDSG
ncbi:hypothetical protein ACYU03_15215 [Pseudomonas sp. X10]